MDVLDRVGHDPVVKLAALLHDVGKAPASTEGLTVRTSRNPYARHEIYSAEIAPRVLRFFGVDPEIIPRVTRLIRWHMIDITYMQTLRGARNLIGKIGIMDIDNWFILRRADSAAYGTIPKLDRLAVIQSKIRELLEKGDRSLRIGNLAVNLKDIKKVFPEMGEEDSVRLLDDVFHAVANFTWPNDRNVLMEVIRIAGGMDVRPTLVV